jgi:hypothetical protein
MSTSRHYNSSDFQQQQEEQEAFKEIPVAEPSTFNDGEGDITTPLPASNNNHFSFPEEVPIHPLEAASATTTDAGGARLRNKSLTDADKLQYRYTNTPSAQQTQ